ncbi:MAG: hypothetical protein CMD25_04185 [Flavobacteriales bacterium]|nr:hypothetical protein [Flavobacteriales bacterium]
MALSKLRLGQLKPADGSTTVGDVYFPQTSLLLPFDGSDAATSTSDLSNRNATVTFAGTAQLSTGQSKFGGSSLLLDGNSDYVSISDSYWNTAFDSGDFTVECWVRFDSGVLDGSTSVEFMATRGNSGGSSTNGWGLRKYNDNFIAWYMRIGSSWVYLNYSQGTKTTVSADTWYHVAVTRSGNTWKLFLNGTAEDTITNSGSITSANGDRFVIGALAGGNFSGDLYMDGYIEDVRVTIGHARYTSNFTAPTSAHLTSAGDVNKHIVVNSDADGVAIGTGGINQARIAKAWAEFDGSGITLNASYNVSSITDHGNRDYTINFGTAMADTNYSIVGSNIGQSSSISYYWSVVTSSGNAKTTSGVRINIPHIEDSSLTSNDPDAVNVIAFGN